MTKILNAECQLQNTTQELNDKELAREIKRLNMIIKEKDKEIEFLKKAAAFYEVGNE